jgi:hypothetical protein
MKKVSLVDYNNANCKIKLDGFIFTIEYFLFDFMSEAVSRSFGNSITLDNEKFNIIRNFCFKSHIADSVGSKRLTI